MQETPTLLVGDYNNYSGFRVDDIIPKRWFIWTPDPHLKDILGSVPSTLKPLYTAEAFNVLVLVCEAQ